MKNGLLLATAGLCLGLCSYLAADSPRNIPDPVIDEKLAAGSPSETAVLAGGCFWGVEAVFDHVKGVKNVVSGFAGGAKNTAHYDQVSNGNTGHAESVQITYDPSQVTYGQLLKVYFAVAHDPTEMNRQGPDSGTQYRSAIFYANDEQKKIASAYIQELNERKCYGKPLATQVTALNGFYPAESYHQHYLENHPDNPYIMYNDLPKLAALKKQYPAMCKR